MRTIEQAQFWAVFYAGVGMPVVVVLEFLIPIVAAAAMARSSPSVIVNSTLLQQVRLERA